MTGALSALSNAKEEIAELVRKYADSTSDSGAEAFLAEALALARLAGVGADEVRTLFADARREAAKQKAAAQAKVVALPRRRRLFDDLIKPKAEAKLEAGDREKLNRALDGPATPRAKAEAGQAASQPSMIPVVVPTPQPPPPPNPSASTALILDRRKDVIADFEGVPDAPKPPAGATEKERLTYPPSRLLGAAINHAYGCTALPDRQLALWGSIVGMAKILDRHVIGPTGSSTVLFNLLLAATGAGKEDAIQFALLLLEAVGYGSLLSAGLVTSVQAVEDIVSKTPNSLVVVDEFGRFFKMIQDQSGNVAQLPGVLCKLWGQKPHGTYPLMQRAHEKEDKAAQVKWPTLALAGASVSEPFWQACGDEHISGGFLNRCVIFDAGIGATKIVKPTHDAQKLPSWMVKAMKQVTRGIGPMQGSAPILKDDGILGPLRLSWGPGAEEIYLDLFNDNRNIPEGRRRDIFVRAPEIAVRLATIAAVWDGSLLVRKEHFKWGWGLAEQSCKMLLAGANENMQVKRDFAEVCRHIKHLLADGAKRWMDIRQKSRSAAGQYGMEILDKAIKELLDCGEVREIPHDEQVERKLRPPVGAPGRWFELDGVEAQG